MKELFELNESLFLSEQGEVLKGQKGLYVSAGTRECVQDMLDALYPGRYLVEESGQVCRRPDSLPADDDKTPVCPVDQAVEGEAAFVIAVADEVKQRNFMGEVYDAAFTEGNFMEKEMEDDTCYIVIWRRTAEQDTEAIRYSLEELLTDVLNNGSIMKAAASEKLFQVADSPVVQPLASTNKVYAGPSSDTYAEIGSCTDSEILVEEYRELGYDFVTYPVSGAVNRKRGYVHRDNSFKIPEEFKTGRLGIMNQRFEALSGAGTQYQSTGTVGSGERVTLLSTTNYSGYYYIEYQTASKTKRGFVPTSSCAGQSKTALGVAGKEKTITYTSKYGTTVAGSLNQYEYCVILGQDSLYYKIEYNTTSSRKTAYVEKVDVVKYGNESIPPLDDLSDAETTPKQTQTVYGGPSSRIYASIGTVFTYDVVDVLFQEGTWYYIEYHTSSGRKRGYVPSSSLNSFPGTVSKRTFSRGKASAPSERLVVYALPNTTSAEIGAVGAHEGVTVLTTDGSYTFIEYSTANGSKRGFIPSSKLRTGVGNLGTVPKDVDVYYTSTLAYKLGSVFAEELVVILAMYNSRLYIEYNSPSGRKRGYVRSGDISGSTSGLETLSSASWSYQSTAAQSAYSGPAATFANIGSVGKNEFVGRIKANDHDWAHIEYGTANGNKQGYIPSSTCTTSGNDRRKITESDMTYPSYTNATLVEYGKSGEGRSLYYYRFGSNSAKNVMILNFAIHGHEDGWPQDGYELFSTAKDIASLIDNDASFRSTYLTGKDWRIYIIPTSNPDGILYQGCHGKEDPGTDCTGRGRCTTTEWNRDTKTINKDGWVDLNRCFESSFSVKTNSRNRTGPKHTWAIEAWNLNELLKDIKSTASGAKNVFVDNHGWYEGIYGLEKSAMTTIFKEIFNVSYASGYGPGYIETQAYNKLGYISGMFEYHKTYGNQGFGALKADGMHTKYLNAIKRMMNEV